MVVLGKTPIPWNETFLSIGVISIMFSFICIIKAAVEFNIIHVHIGSVTDLKTVVRFIRLDL